MIDVQLLEELDLLRYANCTTCTVPNIAEAET